MNKTKIGTQYEGTDIYDQDTTLIDDNHDCHLVPNYGEGHCNHPSHEQD